MPEGKTLTREKKNMVKAILENMLKHFQDESELLKKIIRSLETKGDLSQIREVTQHHKLGKIFVQQINEYGAWSQGFKNLVKQTDKQELKKQDFDDFLLKIQPKIKIPTTEEDEGVTQKSYFQQILMNKKLGLDKELLANLKQKKQQAKKKKNQMQAKRDGQKKKEQPKEKLQEKGKTKVQPETSKTGGNLDAHRKQEKKKEQFRSMYTRDTSLLLQQYLTNRDDFKFQNQKQIALYLSTKLKEYMRKKIQKIIHISKLKQLTYDSEEAGDEFRYFSKANSQYNSVSIEKIPITNQKILQIRYPSKLTANNALRVDEEEKEEVFRNEARKRLEGDKKTDKFLQNYTLDEPKWAKTDIRIDQPRSKTTGRLKIDESTIQFVIEGDPWFHDSILMERSFYK